MARILVFGVLGLICKSALALATRSTTVCGRDRLIDLLTDEARTCGVVVVANHRSPVDDPLMWGVLPWSVLLRPRRMRWTLGAAELCFTNPVTSRLSSLAKILPIVRGDGIFQPSIDDAIRVLDEGGVVTIFSEGRINQTQQLLRFKWGVARLIAEPAESPVLVPVHLHGFEQIMPLSSVHRIPLLGKDVRITFGTPTSTESMLAAAASAATTVEQFRSRLTSLVQSEVERLDPRPGSE
ncbi:lysophospholipid acyltransferase family protein [Nocardia sp. NPDC020380]|uniref:lysophospholipid acyltransferase family protein n=1 Tax=Nocardia sp. NPDC020380 TaxID=3364309 RepID=UPI003796733B